MKKKDKDKKIKQKKPIKILNFVATITLLLVAGFLIYALSLVSKIETEIMYALMFTIFIVNILFIFLLNKLLKMKKIWSSIGYTLLILILIIGQAYTGYFVFTAYSSISGITKTSKTYETTIVAMKESKITKIDDLKNHEIGIISDTKSIDGYILGNLIVKENNLAENNTIIDYDDYSSMISDLYDGKIDAIIIASNYQSTFDKIEKFENIKDETKVIHTMKKKYSAKEINEVTGEETSYNTSGSVTEPFTVLIMGVDTVGDKLDGVGNGDALLLVTFNPKTLNTTILSIPRDSYVNISCLGKENKITHAAPYGESCMIKTIQNFTGIKIDYYVKINFKGVVKLVDALNGITVDVPESLDGVCEQNSDRRWGSKQVCFKKGVQTLNGEAALAMARHRKTLINGAFGREEHQQQIIQAIINKAKTINSASQALNILDAISSSMDTNFTTKQILSFYEIAKAILLTSSSDSIITLQRLYLYGSGQTIYDEGMRLPLWNYVINDSSLKQVVTVMKNNLNPNYSNEIKKMDFNIEETYKMEVIGEDPPNSTKLYTLLPNFVGKTRSYTENWLNNNKIKYTLVEETSSSPSDQVLKQSLPALKRLDLIGSQTITITVSKIIEPDPVIPDDSDPVNPSDQQD